MLDGSHHGEGEHDERDVTMPAVPGSGFVVVEPELVFGCLEAVFDHALRGLPADSIRFHICWGSWHGPHTTDIPLNDIVDLVLSVNAGAYSVEAGNVRHEHEWRVWQDVKLPDGKLLIPGVVSHATNIVEHPQVVADRIVRYAKIVGRENLSPAPIAASVAASIRRSPGPSSKHCLKVPSWQADSFGTSERILF